MTDTKLLEKFASKFHDQCAATLLVHATLVSRLDRFICKRTDKRTLMRVLNGMKAMNAQMTRLEELSDELDDILETFAAINRE